MKKKFLYTLTLATALMTGCQKELLEPSSLSSVAAFDDQPFSTAARIAAQVNGLYTALRSGDFYGGRFMIYNDLRADNFLAQSSNSVTAYQTYTFSLGNGAQEVTDFWASAYQVINRCNLFIDGMDRTGTAVVGTAVATNYIGEAKLLRAISYYSLLQLYARPFADGAGAKPGVPIRLKGNTGADNYDLARSSVAKVYAQIIKDLDDAEAALPANYATAALNTTRGHKNTAIAFKTRVYLAMQKYSEAATEANKIVSVAAPFMATTGVAHALQADITKVFSTPYTTSESIFSMPFLTTEAGGGQSALSSYYFAIKLYSLNPSGIIGDASIASGDKRRTFVTTSGGLPYLSKFPLGSATGYGDWAPVIRYSEVLLNLAEATVRSGGGVVTPRAIALLNAVRGRSDASTVFTALSFPTAQSFYDAILKERNIEFLGEGLRSPDLLHLMLPLPGKGSVGTVMPGSPSYIFPISANELLYNKLMVDN